MVYFVKKPITLSLIHLHRLFFRIRWWLNPNSKKKSPCKYFCKKNSVSCYKLRYNEKTLKFDHYELYRVTNPKSGEYYVFPVETLQKKANRHASYHKSGAFHWREESGEKIIPINGEADYRNTTLLSQGMSHITGQLDGYCLAVGTKVTEQSLKIMLKILDGYIIPPLEVVTSPNKLLDRQNLMIPFLMSPQKVAAKVLHDKVLAEDGSKKVSVEEMEAILFSNLGNDCKFIKLDPQPEYYSILDIETMKKLIELARSLSQHKMGDKTPGFWTTSTEEDLSEECSEH